jgi:hypothetical protein
MKSFVFLLPSILGLSAGLAAEPDLRPATQPAPEYIAHRASGPVAIDGNLSDVAWSGATTTTLGFPWPEQTGTHQATVVRVLWDDRNLYFAFDCDDTDITTRHENRDDPTYEDDTVEIFLNPFADRTEYVGLEINARSVLYDYLFVHPHRLYPNYDLKGAQLAAQRHDPLHPGWTIEGSIPLANFVGKWDRAPVQAGAVWRMNLSRWDGTEPHRVFSIWSDSGLKFPNPHSPQRFGVLRFLP